MIALDSLLVIGSVRRDVVWRKGLDMREKKRGLICVRFCIIICRHVTDPAGCIVRPLLVFYDIFRVIVGMVTETLRMCHISPLPG